MSKKDKMSAEEILKGEITYDKLGQYIWLIDKKAGHQKVADLRGWGWIQHLHKDSKEAAKIQDEIGQFIVDAIKEKASGDLKLVTECWNADIKQIQELKSEVDRLNKEVESNAIGFAEWCLKNDWQNKKPYWYSNENWGIKKTTKQLYELYKQSLTETKNK